MILIAVPAEFTICERIMFLLLICVLACLKNEAVDRAFYLRHWYSYFCFVILIVFDLRAVCGCDLTLAMLHSAGYCSEESRGGDWMSWFYSQYQQNLIVWIVVDCKLESNIAVGGLLDIFSWESMFCYSSISNIGEGFPSSPVYCLFLFFLVYWRMDCWRILVSHCEALVLPKSC